MFKGYPSGLFLKTGSVSTIGTRLFRSTTNSLSPIIGESGYCFL